MNARRLLADALVTGALFALLARVTAALGGLPGWSWVWLAVLHLPLVVRRKWPVAVFWTVTATAFAAVFAGMTGPALLIVPAVAGYTLARSGRVLWPMAVRVAGFVVGWWWHGGPVWDALALSAGFAAAVLLGAYLAELEERARIAREMHDIVAHNLAVMVALADGAAAVTTGEPARGVDMMRKSAMIGRQAPTDVRKLVGLLRESEEGGRFSPQPGLADLDELVGQVRAAGLAVTLTRTGTW